MSKSKVGGREKVIEGSVVCYDCGKRGEVNKDIITVKRCGPTGSGKFIKVCKDGCK